MSRYSCRKCEAVRDTVGRIEAHLADDHGLEEYLSDHYDRIEEDDSDSPGKPAFLGDFA